MMRERERQIEGETDDERKTDYERERQMIRETDDERERERQFTMRERQIMRGPERGPDDDNERDIN